ncbi:MAG: hypothetical protein INR71_06935, partial [Terriglobus roseus]|nr:hypothetical protein [Terriglobus roseus]
MYITLNAPAAPGLQRRPAVYRRRRRRSRSASPSPVAAVADQAHGPEIVIEEAGTVVDTEISADRSDVEARGPDDQSQSGLAELLYHIGENRAREEGYTHRGVTCDACGVAPIHGIRWHCMQCEDFDLCSDCEAQGQHERTHIFCKIKIPAPALVGSVKHVQPVVYTGYPGDLPRALPVELKRRLLEETNFEIETLEALYEQFSCLTTLHGWRDDPTGLGAGIDRGGFDKGFFAASLATPKHSFVYDRYFAFFDRKRDGVVDFEEYAVSVAIHQKEKGEMARLRAVFDGYDADYDGFVSRRDFLRMFRSYFALQALIARDSLAHDEGLSLAAMEAHLASAQPLGAVFKTSYDHRGQPDRVPEVKDNGDESTDALTAAILHEDAPEIDSKWNTIRQHTDVTEEQLRLRWERRRFYTDEEEGAEVPCEWE